MRRFFGCEVGAIGFRVVDMGGAPHPPPERPGLTLIASPDFRIQLLSGCRGQAVSGTSEIPVKKRYVGQILQAL